MSAAFRAIVAIRSRLYERGFIRIRKLDHPVISVGNLTVGGSGKTPLVMALAEALRNRGYRPVVLSRGYGRQSRGIVVVSRGDGPVTGWEDAGDEPYMIASRARGVSVVVGSNRHAAGIEAQRQQLGDLFILDDGFQHRQLHRDMDIVAIDHDDWMGPETLLPSGRWREPRSAIARAHAVCFRGGPPPGFPVPAFEFRMRVDGLFSNGLPIAPESLAVRECIAFAGIARPERFFAELERLGIRPLRTLTFPDHHRYTAGDLRQLGIVATRITTEKDAVRLPGLDCAVLRISAEIPDLDTLLELVLRQAGQ